MFTGIVREVGRVAGARARGEGREIVIEARGILAGMSEGESIAVDGVCLTASAVSDGRFSAQAVEETLRLSTLGGWRVGRKVNLERPLRLGDALGGHWVQGHVDGTARVVGLERHGEEATLTLAVSAPLRRQIVLKGSVAVDGVSLTVAGIRGERVSIALVPYTLSHTTLGARRAGDRVNIECDILGKYVEALLAPQWPRRA